MKIIGFLVNKLKGIRVLFLIFLTTFVILSVYTIYNAPYPAVVPKGDPTAYRNTYIHVPIAIASYVLFTMGFIFSLLFLLRKRAIYAEKSYFYIFTGIIFASLTLLQGSIWAKESWGTYWNWDPRETGVFLLWLAYLVYLGLRKSIVDREKMLKVSSAFAIAAYINVPFSFILPYVMPSLHPRVQETSKLMVGEASFLLPGGIIIGIMLAVFLAEYIYRRTYKSMRHDMAVTIIGLVLAASLILCTIPAIIPWSTKPLKEYPASGEIAFRGVALSSELINDVVHMDLYSGGHLVKALVDKKDVPIDPLIVELPGSPQPILTINGHNLVVKGIIADDKLFVEKIRILTDDSVIINAILFSVTIILVLMYPMLRERR